MPESLSSHLRKDRVGDLNLRPVCSVGPGTSIQEAIGRMKEVGIGCLLVMEQGNLLGIFTERDFVARVILPVLPTSAPVTTVMSSNPRTIYSDASILSAVELMESEGYRHVPVLNQEDRPVGVLSVKDIVHYLVEYFPENIYNLPPSPAKAPVSPDGA